MKRSSKDKLQGFTSRALIVNVSDWTKYDLSTLSVLHDIWGLKRPESNQSNARTEFWIEICDGYKIYSWKAENTTHHLIHLNSSITHYKQKSILQHCCGNSTNILQISDYIPKRNMSSEHAKMPFTNMEEKCWVSVTKEHVYEGEHGNIKSNQGNGSWARMADVSEASRKFITKSHGFSKEPFTGHPGSCLPTPTAFRQLSLTEQEDTCCPKSKVYLDLGDICTILVLRRIEDSTSRHCDLVSRILGYTFWYLSLCVALASNIPWKMLGKRALLRGFQISRNTSIFDRKEQYRRNI